MRHGEQKVKKEVSCRERVNKDASEATDHGETRRGLRDLTICITMLKHGVNKTEDLEQSTATVDYQPQASQALPKGYQSEKVPFQGQILFWRAGYDWAGSRMSSAKMDLAQVLDSARRSI